MLRREYVAWKHATFSHQMLFLLISIQQWVVIDSYDLGTLVLEAERKKTD